MKKISLFFIAVLLSCQTLFAQSVQQEVLSQDWRMLPCIDNQNFFLSLEGMRPILTSLGDFESSKVMLPGNEVVFPVCYKRNAYGIVKLNDKMQTKWSRPLDGIPIKIAMLNNYLIVITTSDYKTLSGLTNDYQGLILDVANGKIITRKTLYPKSNNAFCEPKFMVSPDNKTFVFGVRVSKVARGLNFTFSASKLYREAQQTAQFELFTFNEKLEVTKELKLSVPDDLLFLNCAINNRQEVIVAFFNKSGSMLIKRYDGSSGAEKDQQSFSVDAKRNFSFGPKLFLSTQSPDLLYVSIEYTNTDKDRIVGIYKVDFTNKKVTRSETVIDKAFKKSAKESFVELDPQAGKPDTDHWTDLETRKIIEYNDKLIVCTEVNYIYRITTISSNGRAGEGASRFVTGDAVVFTMDKDMKQLSMQIIPKHEELFGPIGSYSSFFMKDNSLLITGPTDKGSGEHAIFARLNAGTGKLEKVMTIEKKEISKKHLTDAQATIWFDDSFVVIYLDEDGFFIVKKIETDLQKISYK